MCLAVQGKVIELKQNGKVAVVEFADGRRELPNIASARKGQMVLAQQGMLVEVL